MAEKKIFTSLAFQSGAKLVAPKVEAITPEANLTTPTNNNSYYTGSAGQLAYNNGNIWVNNDSIWTKLLNHATTATISGEFTFDRVSNNVGQAPFVIGSNSSSVLVTGLNADKLDGYHARNALNDGGNHSIPRRDDNNLFHVGSATANPTEDTHVANKRYVDSVAQGLTIIDPCYLATTAALPNHSYNNGTNGVGATMTASANGALSIDGNAVSNGKRILVKDQANNAHNGIYTVTNAGSGSAAFVLTRATDYDEQGELLDGDFVFVQEGTVNANRGFVQTSNFWTATTGTVGTHSITWTQFSGAGQISVTSNGSAAAPLTKSGDTINFGYNTAHFTTSGAGQLLIRDGSATTGISTSLLRDNAVTAAKLDDSASFQMARLGLGVAAHASYGLIVKNDAAHGSHIRLLNGSEVGFINLRDDGDLDIWAHGSNKIQFKTGGGIGVNEAFITDNGVGIGADASSPSGTLHVSTARYGSEMVTNGDFASSSDWTGSDWVIANGVASIDGSQTGSRKLSQNIGASTGVRYRITYKISGYTSGQVRFLFGSSDGGTYRSANGTYTEEIVTTSSGNFHIQANASFNGSIDNVSVVEDTLTTAGTLSVNSAADDLVIANNASAGMTIMTPTDGVGGIFFADKNHAQAGGIYYTHGTTNSLTFTSGGYNSVALTLDSSQNAKFEGGVGVGAVAGAGGQGLMVDKSVNDDWVAQIKNSSNTTPYGLQVLCQGSNTVTALAVYAPSNTFKVQPSHSYFSSDLALGQTTAASRLDVLDTDENVAFFRSSHATAANIFIANTNATAGNKSVLYFCPANNIGGVRLFGEAIEDFSENAKRTADLAIETRKDGTYAEQFRITSEGTQNHKANSIVNSASIAGLQDGGACYDFNDTDSFIELASSGVGIFDKQAFTISTWVKLKSGRTNDSVIFSYDYTSHAIPYYATHFRVDVNGKIYYYWNNGSNYQGIQSGNGALTDDTWHHVVVNYKSGSQKIYVDGVEQASATNTDTITYYAQEVWIGKGNYSGGELDGSVRDFKYIPSWLDAGDIRKLYSGENPKKNLNVELVVSGNNWVGDFDVSGDVSSWSSMSGGALAHESGRLKITGSGGDGTYGAEAPAITTTSGKTYLLEFDYESTGSWSVRVGSSSGGQDIVAAVSNSSGSGTHRVVFTATSSSAFITFYELTADRILYLDNVSVTEVGTLVDFNPQSASSTKWRNEAIPSLYHGTVNNATLSAGYTHHSPTHLVDNDKASFGDGDDLQIYHDGSNSYINNNLANGDLILDSAQNFYIKHSGETMLQGVNDGAVKLFHDGNEKLTTASTGVDITGKLGVGGTASDCQLRVAGTSEFENTLYLGDCDGYRGLISWSGDFDSGVGSAHHHLVLSGSNTAANAGIQFKTRAGSSNVDAGVVSADGNWGIGTISAKNKLHVSGADESMLMLQANTGSTGDKCHIGFGCSTVMLSGTNIGARLTFERRGASTGGDLSFHTRPVGGTLTERLVLRDDGTQDHNGNRIVNSQTVNDSWRTPEPSLKISGNNKVVVPTTVYDVDGSEYTFIFRVKRGDTQDTHSIIANGPSRYYDKIFIGRYGTSLTIETSSNGNSATATLNTTALNNEWHEYAIVTNGDGSVAMYQDGVALTVSGSLTDDIDLRTIGGAYSDPNTEYDQNFEINSFRIHNRKLEADEIKGYYNGESTPWKYADADAGADIITGDNSDFSVSDESAANAVKYGFAPYSSNTLAISNEQLVITNVDSNSTAYSYLSTTEGKEYRVTIDLKYSGSGSAAVLQLYDGTSISTVATLTTTLTTYTATFTRGTQTPYIKFNTASGQSVTVDNVKLHQLGEIAAYTPKSIDAKHSSSSVWKWIDVTGNGNHGSITGATVVSDNDHRGLLRVYGNSIMASTYGTLDYNGTLQLGNTNNWCGRVEYNASGNTELRLDNSYNSASAKTTFGMKASAANTRLPVMELLGDGSVKATSASSTNLKQVARVTDHTLNGDGSTKAFTFTHNLGTANIVVSVRTRSAPYEQVECQVLANGDTTTTANNPTNKCTIVFASAPPSGSAGEYKVTVIG